MSIEVMAAHHRLDRFLGAQVPCPRPFTSSTSYHQDPDQFLVPTIFDGSSDYSTICIASG